MDEHYEIITNDEADFLINLYEEIRNFVFNDRKVTIIGLSKVLQIKPSELVEYLPEILQMLNAIESEVRQGKGRD